MAATEVPRHHRNEAKKAKQPWTTDETEAVIKGVDRWGKGKWSSIKDDPDFGPILAARTTIDIKDKYRNMVSKRKSQGSSARSQSPPIVESREDELAVAAAKLRTVSKSKDVTLKSSKRAKHQAESIAEGSTNAESDRTNSSAPSPPPFMHCALTMLPPAPHSILGSMSLFPRQGLSHANESKTSPDDPPPPEKMIVTLVYEQKSYMLDVKATMKAAQLLTFAKQVLKLNGELNLISEAIKKPLDLSKPLKEQIPMFDAINVVVNK